VLSITADGNLWDHMPPTMSCTPGFDLCLQSATVTTESAMLATEACP